MKVLVIGGAGYIGSHAVRELVKEGNDVVVLDALYTGHRKAVDPKAKFYQGDIEDTFLVSKILRDKKIDAVMHFAAYSLVPESVKKPLKYYDNNVTGMISLLHAPETHLIPNILKSAISGDGKFTIFGDDYDTKDGTNVRDYVQVEDLIDAHILALKHMMETNKSDVFNLGTAQGYSNLEILNAAKKVTGIDIPYTMGPRRGGDPDSLVADSTKARTILGWKPNHESFFKLFSTSII